MLAPGGTSDVGPSSAFACVSEVADSETGWLERFPVDYTGGFLCNRFCTGPRCTRCGDGLICRACGEMIAGSPEFVARACGHTCNHCLREIGEHVGSEAVTCDDNDSVCDDASFCVSCAREMTVVCRICGERVCALCNRSHFERHAAEKQLQAMLEEGSGGSGAVIGGGGEAEEQQPAAGGGEGAAGVGPGGGGGGG